MSPVKHCLPVRQLACLMTFIATFFFTVSALSEDKFNLVTENFPPFNMSLQDNKFEHKDENIHGINTDIVKELFRRAGYDYRLKLRNWNYAYNFAQRKAFRGVFGTTYTEARKPLFKWVGPLATNDWVLFAKKNSSIKLKKIEDAHPYIIGCYKNDSRAQFLKQNGYNASELEDDSLNPKRLDEGQVDLWITSTSSGLYYAMQAGINTIEPVFTIKETQLYLAMNLDTPDQDISRLNTVLSGMRDDGTVERILSLYR
ncbi:amino acid ABC transporter substrate-binding protein [Hahella sp. CCB-MM4]|uniref:substrate-binding periplasmic protein n=1 Tax=Hahella sp. (strain CCB-MM4) TaxID=1926491 RepID=UPI000B9A32AC|nr:transporter substrate-binding domain-containing protein [Hahella sp. CCB-MM4]OZG74817.1 amino acid ABC transporter substrate-binding protein [Hahella sp. CCB-MM4]